MKVRKRNGEIALFNPDKIKASVGRASDEINAPLTEGDLNALSRQVEEQLKKEYDDEVSFRAIHMMVYAQLNSLGFSRVADAYDRFEI